MITVTNMNVCVLGAELSYEESHGRMLIQSETSGQSSRTHFVCVQISLSIMAAVLMLPVRGSILNKPLMDDDLRE